MKIKNLLKSLILDVGSAFYGNEESKVIYYHDIHSQRRYTDMSTDMELFSEHMKIVDAMGYTVVTDIDNRTKQIEITFDDGFLGLYDNFSFFLDKKIPVRLFMVSGFLNRKNYLAENQLRELYDTGLLKVGSHTVSHENLDLMNTEELYRELRDSKQRLEDVLGNEVETLCFPRGRFTDEVVEIAEEVGYRQMYTCLPGPYYERNVHPHLICRSLVQHASPHDFRAILRGGDRIYAARYRSMHYKKSATV